MMSEIVYTICSWLLLEFWSNPWFSAAVVTSLSFVLPVAIVSVYMAGVKRVLVWGIPVAGLSLSCLLSDTIQRTLSHAPISTQAFAPEAYVIGMSSFLIGVTAIASTTVYLVGAFCVGFLFDPEKRELEYSNVNTVKAPWPILSLAACCGAGVILMIFTNVGTATIFWLICLVGILIRHQNAQRNDRQVAWELDLITAALFYSVVGFNAIWVGVSGLWLAKHVAQPSYSFDHVTAVLAEIGTIASTYDLMINIISLLAGGIALQMLRPKGTWIEQGGHTITLLCLLLPAALHAYLLHAVVRYSVVAWS